MRVRRFFLILCLLCVLSVPLASISFAMQSKMQDENSNVDIAVVIEPSPYPYDPTPTPDIQALIENAKNSGGCSLSFGGGVFSWMPVLFAIPVALLLRK